MTQEETLLPKHLSLEEVEDREQPDPQITAGLSVKEMEKELIYQTLEEMNGNRTHAAKMLGISIRTLRNKLREYKEGHGVEACRKERSPGAAGGG